MSCTVALRETLVTFTVLGGASTGNFTAVADMAGESYRMDGWMVIREGISGANWNELEAIGRDDDD